MDVIECPACGSHDIVNKCIVSYSIHLLQQDDGKWIDVVHKPHYGIEDDCWYVCRTCNYTWDDFF